MSETVVGIDLGTTNSEVSAMVGGKVQVLGTGDRMLPSCVGLAPTGELLVGRAAKNQLLLYPDRTIKSVKRKMGTTEPLRLGERTFSPQEVSALILRELAEWARKSLGTDVTKAVITVPAFFSDAQRQATREAGALAGLDVIRILNEPTAASLAYGHGDGARRTVMIYDLGGGTFDVSVVTTESEVTEVLASHGNTQLGGDDFDLLVAQRLERAFKERHGVDLAKEPPLARARVLWAAEEAKKRLSGERYVKVREEALVVKDGVPLHLEAELSRDEYEELIRPLVDATLESVSRALDDAKKRPAELDAILLVGGSTRTPLVARLLEERTGIVPRQEVHPDLCVALGAGVLASRLGGHAVERVLVDVSPYSFGPSYLGEREGMPYPHCYRPIIRRNTPLPVTRTESYFTAFADQTEVDIQVFQGDDPDALKNTFVGDFRIGGLKPSAEPNEVLCRMALDLDGILHVTATERKTGLSKQITIENALRARSAAELEAARAKLRALHENRGADLEDLDGDEDEDEDLDDDLDDDEGGEESDDEESDESGEEALGADGEERFTDTVAVVATESARVGAPALAAPGSATLLETERLSRSLLERSRKALERMHDDDREDTIALNERIEDALAGHDEPALAAANTELKELLFFVEGKR